MARRILICLLAIVGVWMAFDLLLHYYFLASLYRENPALWRPFDQMNVALIHAVRLSLATLFIAIYAILIHPRAMQSGLLFGGLMGLVLGVSVGLGTYIHSPIPLALAWGWFIAALLKALIAGVILGAVLRDQQSNS